MPGSHPDPTEIGPWVVERKLGEGGFGAVFAAHRADHPDIVRAIKWLPRPDPRTLARLEREAELHARVQHPGIVRIFELGRHEAGAYLVMELVPGRPLRALVAEAPAGLPLEQAFGLTRGIAEALAVAHEQGVTHRDLKPENILVDEEGAPRIIDFGLALALDVERLTRTGTSMGTLGYMAPEQLDGLRESQGPPTDVWALGTIFYELVTGRPAFSGHQAAIVRKMAAGEYQRPSELRSGLPAATDGLVARCFLHDPKRRYPHARAFLEQLDGLRSGALAAEERRSRLRHLLLAIVSLVFVAAVLGGGAAAARELEHRADARLAALTRKTDTLSLATVEVREAQALRTALRDLSDSSWLREGRKSDAKALDARLQLLQRCAELRAGTPSHVRSAALDLLAIESDAAVVSLAWAAFERALPPSREERLTELEGVLGHAKTGSRILGLAVAGELDTLLGVDRGLWGAALRRTQRLAPAEYDGQASAWARRAVNAHGDALEAACAFAIELAKFSTTPSLRATLAPVLLARATDIHDRDAAGAIEARIEGYRLDPSVPAPCWYPGWVERLAFGDAGTPELRAHAFLELCAEDAIWGIPGPKRTAMTINEKAFFALPDHDAATELLSTAVYSSARETPIRLDPHRVHVGDLHQGLGRYLELARCLGLRAELEEEGEAAAVAGTRSSLERARREWALLVRDQWPETEDRGQADAEFMTSKLLNWTTATWAQHVADARLVLDDIESAARAELARVVAASRENPRDADVARGVSIAQQRLAAALELPAYMYSTVLLWWRPEAATPDPDAVMTATLPKLDEALALDLAAGAPDYRVLEIARTGVGLTLAAERYSDALARLERARKLEAATRILAVPESDPYAAQALWNMHAYGVHASLLSKPPRLDRAEENVRICRELLRGRFATEDELKAYEERTAELARDIEAARAR